jgi:hypothetical protein
MCASHVILTLLFLLSLSHLPSFYLFPLLSLSPGATTDGRQGAGTWGGGWRISSWHCRRWTAGGRRASDPCECHPSAPTYGAGG